jgi:hypothetical protein
MHHPRLAYLGLVLLLFTAGCSDGGLTTDPVGTGDVLHASSDGSNDGTTGLVSSPSYYGIIEGHYIVVLSNRPAAQDAAADAALESLRDALGRRPGARVSRTYRHALT